MKSYKTIKSTIILLLISYLVLGLSFRFIDSVNVKQEIFPVFSWNLFSDVPTVSNRMFKIRIISNKNEDLTDSYFYLDKDNISSEEYYIVNALGHSIISKNKPKIKKYNNIFRSFLDSFVENYQVLRVSSDSEEIIKRF